MVVPIFEKSVLIGSHLKLLPHAGGSSLKLLFCLENKYTKRKALSFLLIHFNKVFSEDINFGFDIKQQRKIMF